MIEADVHTVVQTRARVCWQIEGDIFVPIASLLMTLSFFFALFLFCVGGCSAQAIQLPRQLTSDAYSSSNASPCISKGLNSSFEHIDMVEIGGVVNQSGNNDGYGDFQSLKIELSVGIDHKVKLVPGFDKDPYYEVWRIWIDYDSDGYFDDEAEVVLAEASDATIDASISIPNEVSTGKYAMRISMQYQKAPPPCDDVYLGEVEDYVITITSKCTVGSPCDDGDLCTIDDVVGDDCGCEGSYVDHDGDGLCLGLDIDDMDPCIPITDNCDLCTTILDQSFEDGYLDWIDGGGDCSIVRANPYSGLYSLRLRDDSGTGSSITSPSISVMYYDAVQISFRYITESMEQAEGFILECSYDGSEFIEIKKWTNMIDFENQVRTSESLSVPTSGASEFAIRLRCDASSNGDMVYLDDVVLERCLLQEDISLEEIRKSDSRLEQASEIKDHALISKRSSMSDDEIQVTLYPNPTAGYLSIACSVEPENTVFEMNVFDIYGKSVKHSTFRGLSREAVSIDLSDLNAGTFIVIIESVDSIDYRHSQKVMVKR